MKIVLICPSNMLYMPYVNNYVTILKENNADYTIINWDRFGIEEKSKYTYRDDKIGHQRNFFDYYKYYKFIKEILDQIHFDKIIVFGLQLTFFLKKVLQKKFKGNYIIDIRDYNKVIDYFNIKKVINNSAFVVLSSPGYKEWLPDIDKYIINHNTQIQSLNKLQSLEIELNKEKINVAYIGAIRDYQVNIDFIDSLKNNNKINIFFNGEGNINKNIQEYLNDNNIKNVYLTGRYEREEEEELYSNADLINVLRYNDGINNKTALPNRLYNAVIYGKPMIAFAGTYLADIVKDYELGLILNSFKDVENSIENFYNNFDQNRYQCKRIYFLENVMKDNNKFNEVLVAEFK